MEVEVERGQGLRARWKEEVGGGPPLGCAEWMKEEEAGEGMKLERCRKRLSQSQNKYL